MLICQLGGFLGSGKTTLLINVARRFVEDFDKKVAIIENELGEVGVDAAVTNEFGLETEELFGGCICCTLATGLINTVTALATNYKPDVILIEPTGVAFPSRITQILDNLRIETKFTPITVLVDSSRFMEHFRDMGDFTTRQIKDADIVAINKIDLLSSPVEVEMIKDGLRQINSRALSVGISAKKGEGLDTLMKLITAGVAGVHTFDTLSEEDSELLSGMNIFEIKLKISGDKLLSPRDWNEKISQIIEDLAIGTTSSGANHIGHIKGAFTADSGIVRGSIVKVDSDVDIMSSLKSDSSGGELTLNVIVTDLPKEEIEEITMEVLGDHFKDFQYEKVEHEHTHKEV
ncbi:MAG: GTP-binding protein [Methermicoccaceae archaeon]